jgi:hypothetical protein
MSWASCGLALPVNTAIVGPSITLTPQEKGK